MNDGLVQHPGSLLPARLQGKYFWTQVTMPQKSSCDAAAASNAAFGICAHWGEAWRGGQNPDDWPRTLGLERSEDDPWLTRIWKDACGVANALWRTSSGVYVRVMLHTPFSICSCSMASFHSLQPVHRCAVMDPSVIPMSGGAQQLAPPRRHVCKASLSRGSLRSAELFGRCSKPFSAERWSRSDSVKSNSAEVPSRRGVSWSPCKDCLQHGTSADIHKSLYSSVYCRSWW